MRIAKNLLLVAAMLLLTAGVSQAAFDNSHHDMRSYSNFTTKDGCAQCHGRKDSGTFTSVASQLGGVGGLCLKRCHTGAGIIGTSTVIQPMPPVSVNDQTYAISTIANDPATVYFNNSHGRTTALLTNGKGGASVSWPPGAAGLWPYVVSGATTIECTSCHSVHDNANAPFLWAPMGPTAAGAFDGFCDKCHTESARSGVSIVGAGAAPNGNHPINFIVDNAAAAARATNGRHGRRIVIQDYAGNNIFDVPNPAPNTLTMAPANSWALGGHVVVPGTAAAQSTTAIPAVPASGISTGAMGCYTCHSAHRNNQNGENNLVNLVTLDNTTTFNPICVGCHGAAIDRAGDMNDWKVGATTAYGHPVGSNTAQTVGTLYTTSIGGFLFATTAPTFNAATREDSNQMGTNGAILCTSCHQVHGGKTGTMALTDIGQGTNAICKQCHNGVGIPNAADASKAGGNLGDQTTNRANLSNAHHVTSLSGAVTANMGKFANTSTILAINTTPSWAGVQKAGLGVITAGMDCADCHTFNGTAHNW